MTRLHPTEADVKRDVKRLLDRYGWFWFSPPANQYGANGISDILAVKRGHLLAVETKLKKVSGSLSQEVFQAAVRGRGGSAMVIHQGNLDKLEIFLIEFDQAASP